MNPPLPNPKVELVIERVNPLAQYGRLSSRSQLKRALPFFRSRVGCYVHRVRSGTIHRYADRYSHTSLKLWCGQVGFVGPKHLQGSLLSAPPENSVVCATCEGRVIGAGLVGSPMIAGQLVKYSPRSP